MKKPQRYWLALAAALSSTLPTLAQNAPASFEAETGTSTTPPATGANTGDWAIATAAASGSTAAVTYATSTTDVSAYLAASSPGGGVGGVAPATAARVLTYSVAFPAAGTYDLYARIRVGPNGANDDSFFYANSFGAKSPTTGTDWTQANNLYNIGYTASADIVAGSGSAATGVWKWVNLSQYSFGSAALVTFTVPAGALTQTFQIGAREDGLDFDKFVFGRHGYYFTVANLDAGQQGVATPPVTFVPTGPALATGKSKYLGCAYSTAQAPYFGLYWNAVTPENGGKWGSVQPTNATTFNWTDLDAAYAQAKPATGTQSIFRMHNLIWGAQQPTWVKSLSSADQLAAIKAWMAAVAARYPNIDYIDVVNEPINTPPTGFVTIGSTTTPAGTADPNGGGYLNALGGTGTTGYDWVITSFQLARQYFPTAKLMINEYSLVNSATRTATYATIINLLKARNLIDGVGIQGHAFSTAGTPAATINTNLATLAATGVPLYVTEYDTDGLADADQLAEYQRVFPLFWQNPNIKGVTLWGYRIGHWRTAQGAYLVNADNTERPALVWLRNYVQTTALGTAAPVTLSQQVLLYPNPAPAGSATLLLPASLRQQPLALEVLNTLGQTVRTQTLAAASGECPLGLAGLAPGLYTLRLATPQGTISKRLAVE